MKYIVFFFQIITSKPSSVTSCWSNLSGWCLFHYQMHFLYIFCRNLWFQSAKTQIRLRQWRTNIFQSYFFQENQIIYTDCKYKHIFYFLNSLNKLNALYFDFTDSSNLNFSWLIEFTLKNIVVWQETFFYQTPILLRYFNLFRHFTSSIHMIDPNGAPQPYVCESQIYQLNSRVIWWLRWWWFVSKTTFARDYVKMWRLLSLVRSFESLHHCGCPFRLFRGN